MVRQRYSRRGYGRNNKKMEKMVATLVIAVAVFVLNQMGIDIGDSGSSSSKVKPLKEKSVEQLLDEVKVASPNEYIAYDRDSYTEPYKRIEYKGRKYSLRKFAFVMSNHYKSGSYTDPYTGDKLDIEDSNFDHIIPLNYVNKHGGARWSHSKKHQYATDVRVGVDVDGAVNREKSDKGPSAWLPDTNIDDYCYTWLVIAVSYDIALSPEDVKVIKENIGNNPKLINPYN